MNKTILIGLCMMVLLVGIVNATTMELYIDFEDNIEDETYPDYNPAVEDGAITYDNFAPPKWGDGSSTGKYGNFSSADSDCIDSNWGIGEHSLNENITICFWARDYSAGTETVIGAYNNAAGTDVTVIGDNGNSQWQFSQEDGVGQWNGGTGVGGRSTSGVWEHYCFAKNVTTNCKAIALYRNGTGNVWVSGCVSDTGNTALTQDLRIGCRILNGVNDNYLTGSIDELMIFNSTLDAAEVSTLYTTGSVGGVITSDLINLSSPYPTNVSQFDYNTININVTGNLSYDFNAYLYINGTLNITRSISAGTNVYIEFNTTLGDGDWRYYISVGNVTDNENTTENSFYIDTIFPTISSYSFTSNAMYIGTNITGKFNFTDETMLHSINFSIDGSQIYFINDLNSSTAQYNLSYNPSLIPAGLHSLNITIADGHTDDTLKSISAYNPTNGLFNDYIKYEFDYPYNRGDIKISQKDGSIFDTWTTKAEADRYSFNFKPSGLAKEYTLLVEADSKIHIIESPGTKYKRWLVYDEHWIDFLPYDVEFKRLKDNQVEVLVKNVEGIKELSFNSIGDLNIVSYAFPFYTSNITVTYSSAVSQNEMQFMQMNITKALATDKSEATLFYNRSLVTVTNLTDGLVDSYSATFLTPNYGADSTINFTWYYNVTNAINTDSGSYNSTQLVYMIGVDNCSTYTLPAVNFSFIYDGNDSLMRSDMSGYFYMWVSDESYARSFNLSWSNAEHAYICIYPNASTYNIYGQMEYDDSAGNTEIAMKTYYLYNMTLDNQTDLINLYLTNDTTAVTFTVKDQNDDGVGEAYVHILKYDLDTNSYVTSEIIKSDEEGDALGHIVLNSQWYKFMVVYQGVIYLETEPTKITGTTRTFIINLLSDYFDFYDTESGISTSLSFTNSTRNFAYTFLNPTGNSITACLSVTKRTVVTDTIVNQSCQTASSGTILVNIGTPENVTYIGTGTIALNPTFVTDVLSVSYDTGYKKWGKDGIFMSFLVRMTMAMIGIWNPVIAIILLILADVGMIAMGLYHMGWETIMVYIIMAVITMYKVSQK